MEASSSSVSADATSTSTELEIPEKLLKFDDALANYVREPLVLPRWLPQATWAHGPSWAEDEIANMASMYMPETPFGDDKPDMLLYELGNLEVLDNSFPARLDDFVSGEDHLLLIDRSGAGKTRLIFETLCHHWGLYFTCSSDAFVSPYGADDIRLAIRQISFLGIEEVLYPLNPRSRTLRSTIRENQAKLRTLVATIVLSRLLVFHLFYKHVIAFNLPAAEARKKWLFLQLRPHCVFGREDIFGGLMRDRFDCSYDTLARDIIILQRSSASVLEFVALDEAQVAGRSYGLAFTSPDRRSHRPLLAQLVLDLSFICSKQRLVVSGVEGPHDVIQEAIRASGSTSGVRQFLDMGMFGTLERVQRYLAHFCLSDKVDCHTVFHWLAGRHRVLAVFTAYCLLAGHNRWRSVLATMLYKLTGFYELGDPIIDDISLSPLISGRLLENTQVAWHLRHALYMHTMHSQQVVTLHEYASHVLTLALGRYGSETSTVLIDERIVFLSLYNWLCDSPGHSFHALVTAAQNGSLRWIKDAGFLEGLALVLWDAHAKETPLSHVVQFCGSTPTWANARLRLELTYLASRTCLPPADSYAPSQLLAFAHSPEEILDWFNGATCPFLFLNDAYGVDMLCVVRLDSDHRLLVCLETEKRFVLRGGFCRTRALEKVLGTDTALFTSPKVCLPF
ncbi:hypothetical protein AURDEDRAFT_186225 [Auricularia subglabra TFB-10046 SS5]|nr:hypothetical protein AURDEDRAFT_186225 [Auricularia subglabra TFB-10046 SS5]